MARFSSYDPGTPCWVDLASPDVEASKRFYSAVFGWEAETQFDGDQPVYALFTLEGLTVAGLGGQQPGMEGMPPVWNTYIAVDDCSVVAEAVVAAGGAVMAPPMQVMAAGEMAVLADPTGAVFSVWKIATSRRPRPSTRRCSDGATTTRTWAPWAPTPSSKAARTAGSAA
jgi:predicted enzyme related to lactoylglutathione lyase